MIWVLLTLLLLASVCLVAVEILSNILWNRDLQRQIGGWKRREEARGR